MIAAVWTDYNQMEIQTVPIPVLEPYEVLIRVHSAGVCATDLEVFSGNFMYGRPPHILGHEIAGEVAEIGSAVTDCKIGERVVVETSIGCGKCEECRRGNRHKCSNMTEIGFSPNNGGYAQFVKAPAQNLVRIPQAVSFDEAGILESCVCPVGALTTAGVELGSTALVYGVGPAGIAFIQGAKAMGAAKVIAVARNQERLLRAKHFGADEIVNSATENVKQRVLEATQGKGADLVCEAAGTPQTIASAFECVRCAGKIVLYGLISKDDRPVFPVTQIITNQLQIFGAVGNPFVWEPLLKLVADGRFNLKEMVTKTMPLTKICDAFSLIQNSKEKPIKIVLHPWDT